ncbi:MAG: hypothetical protein JXA73_25715 [Acidobacteria bacterium]|nr:hypothetical protein [Acidobacteriota bacterium]
MYRSAIFMMFLFTSVACFAQLKPTPRVIKSVTDESMVIDDRGSKLEVFPALRAVRKMSTSGKGIAHSEFTAGKSAPISPRQLGVVFNYAMQVRGYITGEITFKMKDGLQASDWLDKSSYPGLAKLTAPNIYLVVARTPSEFVELTKRLQARTDMEWVEPVVIYGGLRLSPDAR